MNLTLDAQRVFPTLRKLLLVDGFEVVVDLARSHGSTIVDAATGKSYLDLFSFVASAPLGHNHPRLASREFKARLGEVAVHKPSNSDIATVELAELLEALTRHGALPKFMEHVFFIGGGTLGVENALKAAFDWKVRKNLARGKGERGHQIVHFRQAFHGRSGYCLSITNTDPAKTDFFPKWDWPRIDNPKVRFAADGRPFVEEAIEREAHALSQIAAAFAGRGDDIAAIIVEPIQGEGGDNHFRPELFQALRKIADEREALLIFDEVQTGLGITGTMWAYEHFVEPDMIAFGKKMQVCGFFASRRLDEVPDNVFACKSRINSTWGGDLTDMVRATRILEVMAEESLCANAEAMGKRLLDGFQKLCQEFPEICENPRGRGLMCAFDVKDRAIRTALLALTFEKGMLVLPTGELGIRARPSLVVKAEEIDLALSIFRDSLIALRGSLGPISAT